MTEGSRRAILAAFLANLGIAASKLAAFFVTGAASMLAEAVHSLADTGNQALLLLGAARGRRAPSDEHPFGYGRERYFWAFVVALVLFSLGALFAIAEGIEKLRHPHELSRAGWAIGVLVVAIVLESFSLRTAVREANAVRGERELVVLRAPLEEPRAARRAARGRRRADRARLRAARASASRSRPASRASTRSAASRSACCSPRSPWCSPKEMKSLLIGESAAPGVTAAIRAALEATPQVRRLIHLRTLHLGPEELLVAAKIELDASLALRRPRARDRRRRSSRARAGARRAHDLSRAGRDAACAGGPNGR